MFYEPTPQEMYDGGFPLPQRKPTYDGVFNSTVDSDIYFDENKKAYVGAKIYPCWYGIKDIGFIWKGVLADPYIEYHGKQMNSHWVEDTMWEYFRDEYPDVSDEEFDTYMVENVSEVYELLEAILEMED